MALVNVPVKSSWTSKVNWTAVGTLAVNLLVAFGLDLSEDTKVAICSGVSTVGTLLVVVFRSKYTTSITKASANLD